MLRTLSLSLSLSLSACCVTTLLTATSHGQSYENPRTRSFVIRVERPVGPAGPRCPASLRISLDENQRAQLAMTIAALEGGNW
jgi:hypothetical protein